MSDALFPSREDWLTALVDVYRDALQQSGIVIPARIRVSCGFPSTFRRSGTLYECWTETASTDGTFEVLISPTVDQPMIVAHLLLQALVRGAPGCMSGKGSTYDAAINAACAASPESFAAAWGEAVATLGAYPHAALLVSGRKTQTTRMLKAVCDAGCGYTIRLSGKWAAKGMPICWCGGTFKLAIDVEGAL